MALRSPAGHALPFGTLALPGGKTYNAVRLELRCPAEHSVDGVLPCSFRPNSAFPSSCAPSRASLSATFGRPNAKQSSKY